MPCHASWFFMRSVSRDPKILFEHKVIAKTSRITFLAKIWTIQVQRKFKTRSQKYLFRFSISIPVPQTLWAQVIETKFVRLEFSTFILILDFLRTNRRDLISSLSQREQRLCAEEVITDKGKVSEYKNVAPYLSVC